ncbi:UDP-N-acetylmuramate dehydrogenase [Glaciecola punicea ACAM 611]|uniref:UDP-N-acetylenolpyruvoylglucosamine reductase n=1 Tax=Glaciecola punicea ACAM 611 TaxID=1121923 RepID=H5TFF7_9ALTE|nr:UDP-N-acetylmuramate dehydrogenase [Glaciecola punicea]GAB57034.1 UDP-N-acetylmuramate dehydrogenase [Glaciecola punicea ACAM 611]
MNKKLDSLKSLHTFSLHARCRRIINIESSRELISTIRALINEGDDTKYLMLGEGSNTVFIDDYPQLVLLNRIKGILVNENKSEYLLTVGAGENWHRLVEFCIQRNIGGFENLALIPGTVGASPIQNIGAYGVEIERFIDKVEFLDTESLTLCSFNKEQCNFGYRDSIFKQQAHNQRIITRVFYRLPKVYKLETSYGSLLHLVLPSAEKVFNEVIAIRKSKLPDPAKLGNAGSFFKNPVIDNNHLNRLLNIHNDMPSFRVNEHQVKIPAAWLIDKLGFRGKKIGNIACHENQALVLVNMGEGEGKDLLTLARQIRDSVYKTFDIELDNEVRLIGKHGLVTL